MLSAKTANLATAAHLVGNITTAGQQLNQAFGYSVQCDISSSGAVSGVLKLQSSIDDVNWADVTSSEQNVTATGVYFYNVTDVMYPWVRVVWTDSGSDASATMNILFFYRGV